MCFNSWMGQAIQKLSQEFKSMCTYSYHTFSRSGGGSGQLTYFNVGLFETDSKPNIIRA